MELQLTAVFQRAPEGYIGFVEELPGANTQGATLDEACANLQEAVHLTLEANRALAGTPHPEWEASRIDQQRGRKLAPLPVPSLVPGLTPPASPP